MELKINSTTNKTPAPIQTDQKQNNPPQTVKTQNKDSFTKQASTEIKKEGNIFQRAFNKIKPYKDKIAIVFAALIGLTVGLGRGNHEKKKLQKDVKDLNENVRTLQDTVRDLEQDKQSLQDQLNATVVPDTFSQSVEETRHTIETHQLDYDPEKSPLGEKTSGDRSQSVRTSIPETHKPTHNRSGYRIYTPPKFIDGSITYSAHIPDSEEEKISYQSSDFEESKMQTTIIEDYADSVKWDSDKIARDLLQNFYDGHGQTLNGVDINFEKQQDGKYKVKISGKSTYSPDKAVLLGESSKRNDSKAAGNYGEGIKMVVLKLLKDGNCDSVKIASDNWKINWQLEKGKLSNKRVLAYSLEKTAPVKGNSIEFETDNIKLLNSIVNSVNHFYYAGNKHFMNPDFENELFGIKVMPKGEKGGIYIAGQQFEFNGEYNNIKDLTIFIKEKPPAKFDGRVIFDPSRDRVSLTEDGITAIALWLGATNSKEDMAKVLKVLEPHWLRSENYPKPTAGNFLYGLITGIRNQYFKFKFPDDCLASDYRARSFENLYKAAGYRICDDSFSFIGMKSLYDVVKNDQKHVAVKPTESELKKIKILREGVSTLAPLIQNVGFIREELSPHIYIFDNGENGQTRNAYINVEGEAIIENYTSKGFWLDRNQLNRKDFIGLLTTALHEITHKFGGDDSAEFSYRLTDVMNGVLKVAEYPDIAVKLKALEQIWNEI